MTKLRTLTLALGVIAALALSAGARADDATPPTAPTARPADGEGFVPVKPGEALQPGEAIPASRLVGIAYGIILAALVAFVGSIAARSKTVEDEIARLRAQIDKHMSKQSDKQDKRA
jgi:hypothetical protein